MIVSGFSMNNAERQADQNMGTTPETSVNRFEDESFWFLVSLQHDQLMAQGDVLNRKAAWPRKPVRRELIVIKIRSSTAEARYQQLDAHPTIHTLMRFSVTGRCAYRQECLHFFGAYPQAATEHGSYARADLNRRPLAPKWDAAGKCCRSAKKTFPPRCAW